MVWKKEKLAHPKPVQPMTECATRDASVVGQLVFVPDDTDGYVLGTLVDIGSDCPTVEFVNRRRAGDGRTKFAYREVFPAMEPGTVDCDDNCALMHLNEGTLLNNCRQRYRRKQIYTYVANILISINPYEVITNLYSDATIHNYCGKSLGALPPHIFAIADKVYREMRRSRESQSIVVSGESGAGKTESQKHILRYLCGCWGSSAGPLEQRILESDATALAYQCAFRTDKLPSSRLKITTKTFQFSPFQNSSPFPSHSLSHQSVQPFDPTMTKTAICTRCGRYRSGQVRGHLQGYGKYRKCTGQLGGYFDQYGYRRVCYVIWSDDDGMAPADWRELYDPTGGDQYVYMAVDTSGVARFGRSDETKAGNKGRRDKFNKCERGETVYRLLENLSDDGASLAECLLISSFDFEHGLTRNRRSEYVERLPPGYEITTAKGKRRLSEITIQWTSEGGELQSGNPFNHMQGDMMRVLKRFFDENPEVECPFPEPAVELLHPTLQALDETLQAEEESIDEQMEKLQEEKRGIKRKRDFLRHEDANYRREMQADDEGEPIEKRAKTSEAMNPNPILEAFGNARTLRNNNSSRFGKFVEVHFDSKYEVAGGYVSHYLLEKTRVCHQQAGERSFHIFYQLFTDAEIAERLRLTRPDEYNFLRGGCTRYFTSPEGLRKIMPTRIAQDCQSLGPMEDSMVDDVRDFHRLRASLLDIGVKVEQCHQLFSILGGILHLGNVEFDEEGSDSKGGSSIPRKSEDALRLAAALLGIEAAQLKTGLTSRMMQPTKGGVKGTLIMVPLKGRDAAAARDALAKAIYSRLFDHIVAAINKCIPFGKSANYIGVLDIAGFEFFETNSFEQLCINYCNERLQAFFNMRILKHEQELYEKEGLNVPKIAYSDNQDCIDLFESRPFGLLECLDEEARLPNPSPKHFTDAVYRLHPDHPRLAPPRRSHLRQYRELRDDEGFIIRHYAGEVCYTTGLFLEKNNDALHISLEAIVGGSSNSLLSQIFKVKTDDAVKPGAPVAAKRRTTKDGGKLSFQSVGSKFRGQLLLLVQKLTDTGTHFVRCIKPNADMAPGLFNGGQILSQLRCAGMTSVLNLMHKGYPSRAVFADLYATYQRVLPPQLSRLDSRLFCKCLFYALGLDDSDYKFGLTRVFFRPGKFAEFDRMMKQDPEDMARLVGKVQSWLHRVRWKKAQYGAWSCIKLKNKILYRRSALITLQSGLRGYTARKTNGPRIAVYRKANTIIAESTKLDPLLTRLRDEDQRSGMRRKLDEINAELMRLVAAVKRDRDGRNTEAYAALCEKAQSGFDSCLIELRTHLSREEERERLRKIEEQAREMQRREEESKRVVVEQKTMTLKRREFEQQRQALLAEEKAAMEKVTTERLAANGQAPARSSISTSTDVMTGAAMCAAGTQTANFDGADKAEPTKYNLVSWTYEKLRDAINTSTNIEFLEACRLEFHRRLKLYREWRNDATGGGSAPDGRRPAFAQPVNQSSSTTGGEEKIQRYFRVPFEKPAGTTDYAPRGFPISSSGFWYAHFDGRCVVRQMEIHPSKPPLLLITGRDDFRMCELTLEQTGLTRKKGAEILLTDFDALWFKFGGPEWPVKRA